MRLRSVLLRLLVTICAVVLARGEGLARPAIALGGEWQSVSGDADTPPGDEAPWGTAFVPSVRPWRADGPHCQWYRKSFRLPSSWSGKRIVLRLEGVKYGQRVYFNGHYVGGYLGGYEPKEYDLTEQAVLNGWNHLLVGVEDWTCVLSAAAKAEKPQSGVLMGSWIKDGILAPIGSRAREFGICGSVSVEARPRVWIDDVQAITSVREMKIALNVTLHNRGVRREQTVVSARIAKGGPGPSFSPRTVVVEPGQSGVVTLEAQWPSPRLWSPEDPHLYSLVVGARTGAMGDSLETRFGFREFWIEGERFFLNGAPINLLATASHPLPEYDDDPAAAYNLAKAAGCVAMRLHAQPWPQQWYDAADETGMLLIWESALWCLSPNYALTQEKFWSNARGHLAAQVKQHRNHPSIVIWSAENELLLCGGDQIEGVEEKVASLADVIRERDPTRPVMFEGDGDPGGKADIINLHYPHELPTWNLWPETAYWLEAPALLDNYPRRVWEWKRDKPLYIGEFGWLPPGEIDAPSVLFGDAAYPEVSGWRAAAKAKVWEMQVIAARDAGVGGLCPWNLWETGPFPNAGFAAHQRAYSPLAAFAREASTRVFAGSVVDRTITVLNDSRQARQPELRWSLAAEDGTWNVSGATGVSLAPAERVRLRVPLPLPASDRAVQPATFALELWEDGRVVFSERQPWKVYGRSQLSGRVAGAPTQVAVYDPEGETTRIITGLGIDQSAIDPENAAPSLRRTPVAVIGRRAFGSAADKAPEVEAKLAAALLPFVRAGGVLLVFEQERFPGALLPLALSDHHSTIAFRRSLEHPALAGLEDGDLAHWSRDGIVGRREILKPEWGGFIPLVDSGGAAGLATAGLAEIRLGRGRIILCQLDVTGKAEVDPIPTTILRNLFAYASKPPATTLRRGRTGALCGPTAPAALEAIGLKYDLIEAPLQEVDLRPYATLLVCDLDRASGSEGRLREFVRGGGQVLLHSVSPTEAASAQLMVEQPILLTDSDGAVALAHRGGPAAGMSNHELAWFGPPPPDWSARPTLLPAIADHTLVPPHRPFGAPWRLEAEEMALPAYASLVPGEEGVEVALYANGEIGSGVRLPREAAYLIKLRARGTPAAGGYPRASVLIDGTPVGWVTATDTQLQTLEVLAALPSGEHRLSVAFTNDLWTEEEDRNLWVDWIELQPVELTPTQLVLHTQPGVLASASHGRGLWVIDQVRWEDAGENEAKALRYLATLLTNLGCDFEYDAGTVVSSGDLVVTDCELYRREDSEIALWTNGAVEAQVEFPTDDEYVLAVSARGTAVDEVYPSLAVSVDGEAVGVIDLRSSGWVTYRLRHRITAGTHQIKLAFTNDDYKPPQDRNVSIRWITVRTQPDS